jgi:hypothetical protein
VLFFILSSAECCAWSVMGQYWVHPEVLSDLPTRNSCVLLCSICSSFTQETQPTGLNALSLTWTTGWGSCCHLSRGDMAGWQVIIHAIRLGSVLGASPEAKTQQYEVRKQETFVGVSLGHCGIDVKSAWL